MTAPHEQRRVTDAELGEMISRVTAADRMAAPPPDHLWASIEAELASEFASTGLGSDAATRAPQLRDSQLHDRQPSNSVVALSAVRRRTQGVLLAAAALVVVLVIGGLVLANGGSSETVLAEAAISSDGLVDAPRSLAGVAEIRAGAEGQELVVSFDAPSNADGYLELWLIDPAVEGMISLGPAVGGGVYALPDGYEVSAYPIVDISIEPLDGVVTHSGRSVLRGELV